jgi:hypothetical protein
MKNKQARTKTFRFESIESAKGFAKRNGKSEDDVVKCHKEEMGSYKVKVPNMKNPNVSIHHPEININREHNSKSIKDNDFDTFGYSDEFWN